MTPELSLTEKVVRVMTALENAGVPAALGGALALAYHAEPRATTDADINVFVDVEHADRVANALVEAGVDVQPADIAMARRHAQVRVWFGATAIDIFFGGLAFHQSCRERARTVPFGGGEVRILSAEDLTIFKVLFNRAKDWEDIGQLLNAQEHTFDKAYALHWLDELVGPRDSARMRFAGMVS